MVESWRNLQGTDTSFEAGFYSKSNDYEKRKWPDPSGVRRLDQREGRCGSRETC